MPIVAKQSEGQSDPIPAGAQHAVCYGVIDLGTQPPTVATYKPSHRVRIMFEVPDERIEIERDGVKVNLPRVISREFILSLGSPKKSTKLCDFLEAWRGRKFTDQERAGFDLKNVIGANCILNIVHTSRNGNTYSDISSVAPLMRTMGKRGMETPEVYFTISDIPDGEPVTIPPSVPEFIRKQIEKSFEFVQRSGAAPHNGHDNDPPPPDDDDIPFVRLAADISSEPRIKGFRWVKW